jgi:hypothetical protein
MAEKNPRSKSAEDVDELATPPEADEPLSPEEEAMLAESWADYERGDYVTQAELRARLQRRGA